MANKRISGTSDLLNKGNDDQSMMNWNTDFDSGHRGVNAQAANLGKLPSPSATGQLNADHPTRSPANNERGFDLGVMLNRVPTPVWAVVGAGLLYYIFLR